MTPIRTIIMGAAGRDFHNFNVFFRNNPDYQVVAFTATQIPDIEGRTYPAQLAGKLYPAGIPIHAEEELVGLIKKHQAVPTVLISRPARPGPIMRARLTSVEYSVTAFCR